MNLWTLRDSAPKFLEHLVNCFPEHCWTSLGSAWRLKIFRAHAGGAKSILAAPAALQNTSALDPFKCMALLRKADLEVKCVRPCLAKQIWKENVQNWALPMSSQGPNQLCLRVGEMEACLGKIASGTNLTWKNYSLASEQTRVETFLGCSPDPCGLSPPHTFSPPKFLGREGFVEPWPGKNVTPKKAIVHCCWRRVRFNTALEMFFILLFFFIR